VLLARAFYRVMRFFYRFFYRRLSVVPH
jgi:hypothetical protein